VVGFEEKEIRGAKMPLDRLRDVSQVRRNSDRAAAEPETEPDRVDRVVRDRKRCYADVADEKNGAGLKCFDDGFAPAPVNPGSREIRKVDRNLPEPVGQKRRCGSLGENRQAANVVAVLVCHENRIDFPRIFSDSCQPGISLAPAQPGIHQDSCRLRRDKGAVTGTTGRKDADLECQYSMLAGMG